MRRITSNHLLNFQQNNMLNTLIRGDCLEVMKWIPDKSIDLVLTDPPYWIWMDWWNVWYVWFNNFEKKDWDWKIPDKEYFEEIFRISKNQIIFWGNYFWLPPTRCYLVWDKWEWFYNRTFAECELAWTSFDKNTCKIKYDPLAGWDYRWKLHPTQKPIDVFRWCIQNYSEIWQTILDCFAWSWTTWVACIETGRNYILIEKDEDYCDIIEKRLKATTPPLFVM